MTRFDLKLFAIIHKWDSYYSYKDDVYSPSNKRLANEVGGSVEDVKASLKLLSDLDLIYINLDEDGYRSIKSIL